MTAQPATMDLGSRTVETWAYGESVPGPVLGARKDTVIVRRTHSVEVDLEADNPGQWALHCHSIYHAEAGMMTLLSYRK